MTGGQEPRAVHGKPLREHVTVSLTPVDGETELRLRHTGFGPGEEWDRARAWHERAWVTCLDKLEALIAGRPLPRPWDA